MTDQSENPPSRLFGGSSFQASLVARVLAALYAAGATLAALTVAMPHPANANVTALLAVVGDAYIVAALLYWQARSLSPWILRAALCWGSTLITAVAYFSGDSPSPLIFFYLWVFLYASYFFSKRETAVQVAYVGLTYGVLLVARAPTSGILAW